MSHKLHPNFLHDGYTVINFSNEQCLYNHNYRPRSEGDNVIGSVRPSVRVCVTSPMGFVSVSVIKRCRRIVSQMRLIGFLCLYFVFSYWLLHGNLELTMGMLKWLKSIFMAICEFWDIVDH